MPYKDNKRVSTKSYASETAYQPENQSSLSTSTQNPPTGTDTVPPHAESEETGNPESEHNPTDNGDWPGDRSPSAQNTPAKSQLPTLSSSSTPPTSYTHSPSPENMLTGLKGKAVGIGRKALKKVTPNAPGSGKEKPGKAGSGTMVTNVTAPISATGSAGAGSNLGTSSAATYAAATASAVATSVTASSGMYSSATHPNYYGLDEDPLNNEVPPPPPPSPNIRHRRRRLARILKKKLRHSSTSEPQPFAFYKFANLPAELRIKIWEYHIMDTPGRVVQVHVHPKRGECTSATPIPYELKGALLACQESRYEVNRLYPQRFGTRLCPPKIRFNFDRDTFYLNTVAMPIYFLKAMRSISEEELNSIRKWALPYYMWTQFTVTRTIEETYNNIKDATAERAHVRFIKLIHNPNIEEVHLIGIQDWLMGVADHHLHNSGPSPLAWPHTAQAIADYQENAIQYLAQHQNYIHPVAPHPYLPARCMHHLPYGRTDVDTLEFMDTAPLMCYSVKGTITKMAWIAEMEKMKNVPIYLSFLGYNGVKAGKPLPAPWFRRL